MLRQAGEASELVHARAGGERQAARRCDAAERMALGEPPDEGERRVAHGTVRSCSPETISSTRGVGQLDLLDLVWAQQWDGR
jgi:hypothetical protein